MARIPDTELERLKREVSVERLAEARGVELRRHGADLIGRCPFHDDREPSLVITPAKNLWHCLGACQQGGSVVDWVMKAGGVSFRHAVEILRAGTSFSAGSSSSPATPRRSAAVKVSSPLDFDADDRLLLSQVVDYYHAALKRSPEALGYLEKRGLACAEMIDRFKMGFADRTLGYRLPAKTRQAGAELRGRLQRLGVLRDTGHEHFNGSIVVPIFDEAGDVSEIYGRKITPGLRPGTPLHLYLPGPHRGIWNLDGIRLSKEVILCEALLDALSFWCAGFRNVTASYGIEGFTADHVEAFGRFGTERVLVAYDRDDAGERAAAALAEKLSALAIAPYRVEFPKGMDANEYAEKVKPPSKSLALLLEQARWMGKGEPPARGADASVVELRGEHLVAPETAEETRSPIDAESSEHASSETIEEPEATYAPSPPESESSPPLVAEPPAPSSSVIAPVAAPPPHVGVAAEVKAEEVVIRMGDRRYRIRGLAKNLSFDHLKVNVLASRGEGFFVDTLDLYSARHRAAFVKQAALEMTVEEETIRRDLGKVLLKLEELQEAEIHRALEPRDRVAEMPAEEREAALALLRDPKLLSRILADFERCGVTGEETNKLAGYLAAVSRKLEEPLAVIIQSSSAAGKSSLMEAVLALVPEEDRVKYSAMTGQSLFYLGEKDLRHKVLAVVEQEGAERAAYALKLLQSEGELTIASTGKDPESGKLVTHEYRVEGPVAVFLTSTAVEIGEELLNRGVVLTVDEDREQTRAIHRLQREAQTLEGLLARQDRDEILALHQNAQRLLRPLLVANPFARHLTFLDNRTRTRRDHVKYLTLIRTIALLHQYQRPVRTTMRRGKPVDYMEVTLEDVETANRLAHEVLGRSLDELSPQTRRLLGLLDTMVAEACVKQKLERSDYRFSRREVSEATGWTYEQVRVHIDRLLALEHVIAHRGGRGQSFVYELLYDGKGKDGRPFLTGLIDVEALRVAATTESLGGRKGGFGGSLGVHSGAIGPRLGFAQNGGKQSGDESFSDDRAKVSEKTHQEHETAAGSSYATVAAPAISLNTGGGF